MRRVFPLVLLAALMTGCSGSEAAAPSAAPAVPLEQPSPTPTPTPTGPSRLGSTQETRRDDSLATVTLLRVRQPLRAVVPGLPERTGYEYIGLEVKVCVVENTGEAITVSWAPWSIEFTDDTSATPLSAWGDQWWSVPLYPQNRTMRVGACARGWVPFEVPKGSRPKTVVYQPGSGNALEWRVK